MKYLLHLFIASLAMLQSNRVDADICCGLSAAFLLQTAEGDIDASFQEFQEMHSRFNSREVMSAADVLDVLNTHGLSYEGIRVSKPIEFLLSNNLPIIIHCKSQRNPHGHFMTVVPNRSKEGRVLIAFDPAFKQPVRLSEEQIEAIAFTGIAIRKVRRSPWIFNSTVVRWFALLSAVCIVFVLLLIRSANAKHILRRTFRSIDRNRLASNRFQKSQFKALAGLAITPSLLICFSGCSQQAAINQNPINSQKSSFAEKYPVGYEGAQHLEFDPYQPEIQTPVNETCEIVLTATNRSGTSIAPDDWLFEGSCCSQLIPIRPDQTIGINESFSLAVQVKPSPPGSTSTAWCKIETQVAGENGIVNLPFEVTAPQIDKRILSVPRVVMPSSEFDGTDPITQTVFLQASLRKGSQIQETDFEFPANSPFGLTIHKILPAFEVLHETLAKVELHLTLDPSEMPAGTYDKKVGFKFGQQTYSIPVTGKIRGSVELSGSLTPTLISIKGKLLTPTLKIESAEGMFCQSIELASDTMSAKLDEDEIEFAVLDDTPGEFHFALSLTMQDEDGQTSVHEFPLTLIIR